MIEVTNEQKENLQIAVKLLEKHVYGIASERLKKSFPTIFEEDFYLNNQNCIDRLVDEWNKYGMLIIAADFDNTLFDYYKKGHTFDYVVSQIKELKKMGCHVTIFTSCDESRFPEIKEYLKSINFIYDSINETPDFIPFKGRKVYYNAFYDDRAGLSAMYYIMQKVIQMRKIYLHSQSQQNSQDIDF